MATIGALLALAGCGASENPITPQGQTASDSLSFLSGSVRGQRGEPLVGVRMVAMERTTGEQAEVVTRADGSFYLVVPRGVYDVALDHEGDLRTATAFYGPVVVTTGVDQEFALPDAIGHSSREVFGKVSLESGLPAANRALTSRPGFIASARQNSPLPGVQSAITSADGSFSMLLDSEKEIALDLEVADAKGELFEWLDMAKREGKPCYVELVTGGSTARNVLRCFEAEDPTELSSDVVLQAANPVTISPFTYSSFTIDQKNGALLQYGELPIGTEKDHITDIVSNPPNPNDVDDSINQLFQSSIKVLKKKWLWYDYSIYIKVPNELLGPGDNLWSFTDRTRDSYLLYIYTTLWSHRVSYNSDDPNIIEMSFGEGVAISGRAIEGGDRVKP